MSDAQRDLTTLVTDLTRAVEELQSELEPSDGPFRPPTPRQLARFTSEVTIPAIVLVLETNVRALKLLQRTLRFADGRAETTGSESRTRERAQQLGRATLARLDETLADLQDALEGRPPDDDASRLLEEVRSLEAEVEAELATPDTEEDLGAQAVPVDVDAELQSLKDNLDQGSTDEGNNGNE